MRKILPVLITLVLGMHLLPVHAQEASPTPSPEDFPPDQFYRGLVLSVENTERDMGGTSYPWQVAHVRLLSGPESGTEITVEHGGQLAQGGAAEVRAGDTVVIDKSVVFGEASYAVTDHYRLPPIALLVGIFFAIVAVLGRRHGITSLLGLAISAAVIGGYILPRIAHGGSPLLTCLVGATIIVLTSLYLAHGFNKRTSIALLSTLITLGIAVGGALAAVSFARLFGIGTEETLSLQLGPLGGIDFRGLLLGGIILGALGVLDDITTAQSATVDELSKANPQLGPAELYRRGLSVGREHIASLVNTLFLAYAGVSLPLFLIFYVNSASYPLWMILNTEQIADEIVRTLVGSTALVLAVPITTFLAARYFGRKRS